MDAVLEVDVGGGGEVNGLLARVEGLEPPSTTEHSFQGISTSRLPSSVAKSVTHVFGAITYLGPHT
jgi:hypothetical protein